MKRKIFIGVTITAVLAIVGLGLVPVLAKDEPVKFEQSYIESKPAIKEDRIELRGREVVEQDLVDKAELIEKANIPETDVQLMLHYMSHDKIHADKKWGYIPMTYGNLEEVHLVVSVNEDEYEHSDLYYEILDEWFDEDFSNAVEHHNAIWTIQKGNVGEATRLMTEEEQAKWADHRYEGFLGDFHGSEIFEY